MSKIAEQWNKVRKDLNGIGDLENKENGTEAQQFIEGALHAKAGEFVTANEAIVQDDNRQQNLKKAIEVLAKQGEQNVESYIDCFVSENILRSYIKQEKIDLSLHNTKFNDEDISVSEFIKKKSDFEQKQIDEAGVNTTIRDGELKDLSFLELKQLADIVDEVKSVRIRTNLTMKSDEYRPLRNAVMHTALLTDGAKRKLSILKEEMIYRLNSIVLAKTEKTDDNNQCELALE